MLAAFEVQQQRSHTSFTRWQNHDLVPLFLADTVPKTISDPNWVDAAKLKAQVEKSDPIWNSENSILNKGVSKE